MPPSDSRRSRIWTRTSSAGLLAFCVAATGIEASGTAATASATGAKTSESRASSSGSAQSVQTTNCDPCRFTVGPEFGAIVVRFRLRDAGSGGKAVEALEIESERTPGAKQSLPVRDMDPVREGDKYFIEARDINFDGLSDLMLITRKGVANAYADYWVFDSTSARFNYVGNFPILKVDAGKRLLSSYERGGQGGMLYEAKRYRFDQGKLVVVEAEQQEATERHGVFRKTLYKLKDGKLQVVRRENVKAPPAK
jgi:hypothetical protein